ncbi:putative diguanylate cyclase YdaM [Desulfosporosinus acididurans]|uniref:Putative diguanylate cyclase YdaM n=1 Tax=Desulfosporosinus acididurans TaxID=476652 RepID=A0A0J1FP30_9FIRM|nr:GGDEF domain-containing protein [Desulfosporosinus acididurans]KLU65250.1 putative diguanylate cyclase YdaM [Desulfosporosinus acididurans]
MLSLQNYFDVVGLSISVSILLTIKKIRKIDTLARWGGEEFILLLPETTINKAVVLGEKLRERLSRMDISNVGNVTASFGVAEYNSGDTVDTIVQKADDMMYQAKSAGRNCVRYIENENKYFVLEIFTLNSLGLIK